MAQKKSNALLQSNIANYKLDTSKFIVLKPLNPIRASSTAENARDTAKRLARAKAKSNA